MSQETRGELVARFARFVGEVNDADLVALANDLCAEAVFKIWLAHPFAEFVMPIDYVFSTVSGTNLYVLPTYFGRVAKKDGFIRNRTTGTWIKPLEALRQLELSPEIGTTLDTSTNEPSNYAIAGKTGVSAQVAAAGEALEVLSSSVSDTDVLLQIEGLSGGEWTTTQVTLVGTTPVALGTWTYVQAVGKSYPAGTDPPTPLTSSRGTVTVRKTAGAVTRLVLLPHEASREHYQLRLHATPGQVYSIAVPTIRLPRRLFQDSDPVPAMWGPAVFEEMHIQYRVSTGEFSPADAAAQVRPVRLELIGYDNELKSAQRPHKRPFGS